jgi:magnesium chelatase family protein
MLAHASTFAINGLESRRVVVEIDVRAGLPSFAIVGLPDRPVREARERVRGAILNSGFEFPLKRVTVNLAPAGLAKTGPGFDLAIACTVLVASGQVPVEALRGLAVLGELGLDGEVRAVPGALAVAEGALEAGLKGMVLPHEGAGEAALVEGLEVIGVATLTEVVEVLRGGERPAPARVEPAAPAPEEPDLADVHGHPDVIEAMTVAAAGGHNLLLSGPPGVGKTMLARRLPSILPPLSRSEALEVMRIHSIAGLRAGGGLVSARPFRAPHHTISASGLVGGGSVPIPGEATLAHHGVLFLDELSEFPRPSLEALRQPLEEGRVTIVRGQQTAIFPTRFMLVAATNPCPCGHAPSRRCRCTEADFARHRRRLSGPLLDRIDLLVPIQRPSAEELARSPISASRIERERVLTARERQDRRLAGTGAGCNAQMDTRLLRTHLQLRPEAEVALNEAYRAGNLSARARDRALRVARTIADLAGSDRVGRDHAIAALGHRHDSELVAEAVA